MALINVPSIDKDQAKIHVHHDQGVLQIEVGANQYQQKFIQDIDWAVDDSEVIRDRIDDAAPMFTPNGDVLGTFIFDLLDSIELWEADATPGDQWTASYWIMQIAARKFPSLTFIRKKYAKDRATGNKFANIKWTGRILKVNDLRTIGEGVDRIEVTGEITGVTKAQQEAT